MSIIKLFMKTGRICALKTCSPKIKKLNAESSSFIIEKINEDVSITIKSLKTKLSVDKNVIVSASTIERVWGITGERKTPESKIQNQKILCH